MKEVMMILLISATMTGLVTEAVKKMCPGVKSENLLAGVCSVVVSCAVCAGYIILNHVPMTVEVGVYIVCVVVLSWLCAMLGYDKVMQTIAQIKKG